MPGIFSRSIIHIDMDAFYAAVEQRDFAKYRGRPLIVGGDPDGRGVVATCSYQARQYGIHSAMPCALARRKCPQAVFVRPRFPVYKQVSKQIQEILAKYTARIEPLALDEAFLDVSDEAPRSGSSMLIAKDIRRRIQRETRLTASAGVSYNKFLAKVASDRCKPDGLLYISGKEGAAFVKTLPIRKFFGVGPATEEKMHSVGIYTGADLATWESAALQAVFGKSARYYFNAARGIDQRPVEVDRLRKSVSTEDTFGVDLKDRQQMLVVLQSQSKEIEKQLNTLGVMANTLTLKVKFADFSLLTRSVSSRNGFRQSQTITETIPALLDNALIKPLPVRLLGIAVSNLLPDSEAIGDNQISLW